MGAASAGKARGTLIAAWAEVDVLAHDVEQTALVLWAGMHGVACLILDGVLRLDDEQRAKLIDARLDALIAGVGQPGR